MRRMDLRLCAWKWSSALWSCGAMAADSNQYVSIGMKHILKTLSFHCALILLFFQNCCNAAKPALALAMRALMSLCVLVSSVMMTPR